MNFAQANALLDEILDFLKECGGVYATDDAGLEERLLECVAHNQYLIKRGPDGNIIHAITYWLINQSDMAAVERHEQPQEKLNGDTVYVVEHGNKAGRTSLIEMVRILRNKAPYSCWHHKGQQFKKHTEVCHVIR